MGPKHAERLVRQGLAVKVTDHVIRMVAKPRPPTDPAELERRRVYDFAAWGEVCNQTQARGIPFAGNVERLGLAAAPTREATYA